MIERGVLVMNKPAGFTSFDVIGKLRGMLHIRRLGHTGTLDPMATGVLPVLIGTAARASDILPDETKAYDAQFQLGVVTDTQDSTGTVLARHDVHVSAGDIEALLPDFCGEIEQIPPMYSAVQVNGKRLYELARQGREIERPSRRVEIQSLQLLHYDAGTGRGSLAVVCGKGTYVRTLLHDMGLRLGCGCMMTGLTRTMACGFRLEEAYSFETVQAAMESDALDALVIPVDRLFEAYPALHLSEGQAKRYRNGVKLDLQRVRGISDARYYRVYDNTGYFCGLSEADFASGCLRVYKNL